MPETREKIEKAIATLESKLAVEKDQERRAELAECIQYLRHKNLDVSAHEYAADVKDDFRFRQW